MSPQAPMIERIDANQTWNTDDGTDISYYVLLKGSPSTTIIFHRLQGRSLKSSCDLKGVYLKIKIAL